ncbi:hypothetical protein THOM_0281 [Trachipleistophora hominis]|uniref:Uncharacterized protein n=1 Tax=Trachipleistophora hominis TaxID=72359 RepID=L7K0H2_TRAHO|nr:hypothetical protein THOM_0281 [Trachipleistophora hominis]
MERNRTIKENVFIAAMRFLFLKLYNLFMSGANSDDTSVANETVVEKESPLAGPNEWVIVQYPDDSHLVGKSEEQPVEEESGLYSFSEACMPFEPEPHTNIQPWSRPTEPREQLTNPLRSGNTSEESRGFN